MAEYNQDVNEKFLKDHVSVGWPWRMLTFVTIIFLMAILSYLGLIFGYSPYLEKSTRDTQSEINSLSLQIESKNQQDFVKFYSQIVNLRTLSRSHIVTSKIIPLLESVTHRQVAYSGISLSVQERTLRIDGIASSYESMAAQLALYEQAPWVTKVILDNSSLSEQSVRFGVRLIIKDETIKL
jgi:hypothetical protein